MDFADVFAELQRRKSDRSKNQRNLKIIKINGSDKQSSNPLVKRIMVQTIHYGVAFGPRFPLQILALAPAPGPPAAVGFPLQSLTLVV